MTRDEVFDAIRRRSLVLARALLGRPHPAGWLLAGRYARLAGVYGQLLAAGPAAAGVAEPRLRGGPPLSEALLAGGGWQLLDEVA